MDNNQKTVGAAIFAFGFLFFLVFTIFQQNFKLSQDKNLAQAKLPLAQSKLSQIENQCGGVIKAGNRKIMLENDINCTGPSNGLTIDIPPSHQLMLDCAGHVIRGFGKQGAGVLIYKGANITIRDCRIINFKHGILTLNSSNVLLDRVRSFNSTYGFTIATSTRVTLDTSLAYGNDYGLYITNSAATSSNNIIYGNKFYGLYAANTDSIRMTNSTVCKNQYSDVFYDKYENKRITGANNDCDNACNYNDPNKSVCTRSCAGLNLPTPPDDLLLITQEQ